MTCRLIFSLKSCNMSFEKIYINNNPIVVTQNKAAYIVAFGALRKIQVFTKDNVMLAKRFLEETENATAIIEAASLLEVLKSFAAFAVPITAAGGLVINDRKEILLIERRGVWDLPKGKTELNESIEQSALREVQEETGLNHLYIEEFLCNTYHYYNFKGEDVIKTTYWYKMQGSILDTIQPQAEEEITAVKWVPPGYLNKYLNNTFETIRDVFRAASLIS